ncbi:hypothetical protein [Moraxella lacunata]|uniref:hypothetical protein n=1 Tax=Moraxella lacunata TaxID=477 RepID=UPI003EE03373
MGAGAMGAGSGVSNSKSRPLSKAVDVWLCVATVAAAGATTAAVWAGVGCGIGAGV